MKRYAILCDCDERCRESTHTVALIDDHRPEGGTIEVRAPRGDEHRQQMVIVNPPIRFQNRPDVNAYIDRLLPYAALAAEKSQSMCNVTHTVWSDGHSSWAIRCMHCSDQTQISGRNLAAVVTALAKAVTGFESREIVEPGTGRIESTRYVVPLGVLQRAVLRING